MTILPIELGHSGIEPRGGALATAVTVIDILSWRARSQPDRLAYRFIAHGGSEPELAYRELEVRAVKIATGLARRSRPADRVLLVLDPGLDYIAAFFGCLVAGLIAVPVYPTRGRRTVTRIRAVAEAARSAIALTSADVLASVKDTEDFACVAWLTIEEAEAAEAPTAFPPPAAGTTAFIQFTAGSTGAPRGVVLTHDNLMHNLAVIHHCFGHSPASVGVIWLPPYHDMGLIGGILAPLFGGFPVTLMSPLLFLQHPIRWLEAISRQRATTSGGPDFAYELCVRKVTDEQRASLDLGSWQVAFNGAEPIRAETLERFAAAFTPSGFDPRGWFPCYGLAEATLLVSGGPRNTLPRIKSLSRAALSGQGAAIDALDPSDRQRLVGSGRPHPDQTIRIVDPDTRMACQPGRIGEIWIAGPSVARQYWDAPELTAHVFHAKLTRKADGRAFLRTGDLGFIADGVLFVTGRIKDLIIIRGLKHYPQDIERTVEASHPALRQNAGAAFSIGIDGEEQLVVVNEIDRSWRKHDVRGIKLAISTAVTEVHGVKVMAVVLLRFGALPKTSSGKVRRSACRSAFLGGSLHVWSEEIEHN